MFTSKRVRRILLCLAIAAFLCIIFFSIDLLDGITRTYTYHTWVLGEPDRIVVKTIAWADDATAVTVILAAFYIFYIVIPTIVYDNAKRHGRNAVRWTTAFVVFTPVLAGIAYLLTWPKGQKRNS